MKPPIRRVLILCTGNSARSQMAEGLLRAFGPGLEVHSAGTVPAARVHPSAVKAMKEVGIDISGQSPKNVDRFLDQSFDVVMTVCDHARETCPVFSGTVATRLHVPFPDPAAVTGDPDTVLDAFRDVRDQIAATLYDLYPRLRGWRIRAASEADAAAAADFLHCRQLPIDGLVDQFGPQYVICERGRRIVGVAGIEEYGRDAMLRSVAVDESERGTGLGTWLVRDRLEYAQGRRFRAVYLLTTTAADWFKRFGFENADRADAPERIAHSSEFASACPASASFMGLSLERPVAVRRTSR